MTPVLRGLGRALLAAGVAIAVAAVVFIAICICVLMARSGVAMGLS